MNLPHHHVPSSRLCPRITAFSANALRTSSSKLSALLSGFIVIRSKKRSDPLNYRFLCELLVMAKLNQMVTEPFQEGALSRVPLFGSRQRPLTTPGGQGLEVLRALILDSQFKGRYPDINLLALKFLALVMVEGEPWREQRTDRSVKRHL